MNDPILTGSDVYDLLHNSIIAKIRPPTDVMVQEQNEPHTHVKWNYKC